MGPQGSYGPHGPHMGPMGLIWAPWAPWLGGWCRGHQPGWTQNCLGHPGQPPLWVPRRWTGAGAVRLDAGGVLTSALRRVTKPPKCWGVLACGTISERPRRGYSKRAILGGCTAGTKVLGCVGSSMQLRHGGPNGCGAGGPCPGGCSLGPLVATRAVACEFACG